ncbi:sugar hydrolase [Siphonobacter sp. BAB-5405]|uniref:GH92 family glycosyl hydrolase n=1 Tax=Siphonobacter sp. BAB-5405 TaxID=1864825 RepID=UPI000C80581D|nr:GH92 family glycosyl hydrolase [Siphonobacter sp. BAB-5405]PMD97060.1 sugar hydrolase [Siphonobacter sp. BAB-5405]
MKKVSILALGLLAAACGKHSKPQSSASKMKPGHLTQYVDPRIGTGFHGHVFLGANVPFGAVQIGPTQANPGKLGDGWDWCSGYHVSDSLIAGFSHTHLSGTGIGDLGDVLMIPTTGPVRVERSVAGASPSGYMSRFSHDDEVVRPGYYAVKLQRYDVGVELTASERVGMHRYTFPKSDDSHILIDLKEGIGWDRPTDTYLEQKDATTLIGYRFSTGWAKDQRLYFAIVFSKPIEKFALYQGKNPLQGNAAKGTQIKGVLSFATKQGDQVLVKVGISPVSEANALANIQAEVPGWNFDQVAKNADEAWNTELSKIQVQTKDQDRLKVFYTALYHTMIAPSTFNDHNGDYRGADQKVYKNANFKNLTTFSLWDTYRAANPLLTITQGQRVNDIVNTMLHIYQQQGKLPVWHLVGNETNTMPGNSALPIISDAILKGYTGFDVNLAFEAMKKSAMLDERGLDYIKAKGYIPANTQTESVAKNLEYSIDDWAVAQVAKKLGKTADYEYFSKRAKDYKNNFDASTRFMRGRVSDTEWRTPFNPFVSRHEKDDFAEGNAWQYTWLVPQDVEGLIELLGGEKGFTQKLDSLFIVKGDMGAEASNDISGLIGQYAHGNEPSHHITYLYPYVGQPWKTAEKVRYILDHMYTTKPDGIIGNEDVGQMSAWYILSAMGFYPVNPANGAYVFGSPVFDQVDLKLGNGKVFHLKTVNNGPENKYIQSIKLNGKPYTKSYLLHKELMNGGEMEIEMGKQPSQSFGVAPADRPRSIHD